MNNIHHILSACLLLIIHIVWSDRIFLEKLPSINILHTYKLGFEFQKLQEENAKTVKTFSLFLHKICGAVVAMMSK